MGTDAVGKQELPPDLLKGLQDATEIFFDFLHHSNFATVINETALDLMVGTGALAFDEGDNEMPFIFSAVPLSRIEIEEGPHGTIETTFQERKPKLRNLLRMYPGLTELDLPVSLAQDVGLNPEKEVPVIQLETYYPAEKHYYGIDKARKASSTGLTGLPTSARKTTSPTCAANLTASRR